MHSNERYGAIDSGTPQDAEVMELYCRKCTRAETIKGDMGAALKAGWQVDRWDEGDLFLCPKCSPKPVFSKAS